MLTPTSGVLIADYNTAVLNGNTTHARLVFPVQNITLTDDDISADGGLVINEMLNPDTDLIMGKAVSKELVVRLINGSVFNSFDWTEEFRLDFGVDIGGSTKWVQYGYFHGKKPKRTVNVQVIEFTAMDRMQQFDTLADEFLDSITYPVTMEDIFQGLCTYVGLNYTSGNEISGVMNMVYTENPFTYGISCRDLLAYIAEANCCYAKVTASGAVKLVWFTDQTSNYTLTEDQHFGVEIEEITAPEVDSVKLTSTEDDAIGYIYPVGQNDVIYNIIDNPLLLALGSADRITVITAMLNRFATLGAYTPVVVSAIGNWMVETGDIIQVEHDGTEVVDVLIFNRTLQWDGGCGDVYECTGEADREELSSSAKEQYKEGGKMAGKYSIVSGVDITEEGVTVSGECYVKIISGGTFDLNSANFKINSETGVVESGNWKFDEEGLSLREEIDNHLIDMYIGKDTVEADAYYGLFIDRDIKQFTVGIQQHYAPILKFGAIDNRGESDDFSWGLGVDYVENPLSPLSLGYPGLIPTGNNNWYLGSPDNPFGRAHIGIGNFDIAQVDSLVTKDLCGGLIYTTLASMISRINECSTGNVMMLRFTDALTGTFFTSSNNYGGVILVLKASSNNAYYLAFNRAAAAVGNISLENGNVNSKTAL